MTPPEVASDVSSEPVEQSLEETYSDELVAELDAMMSPEGASADPLTEEPAPADSPKAPPDAKPVESPPVADAKPTDTVPQDPPELVEFFKNAKPLTYKVDGQDRVFDGILEVAGQGAVIAPEHVNRIRNTLGLAEKSIADNKALYERTQQYERAGGTQRIAELEEQVAQLDAAGTRLLAAFSRAPADVLMQDEQGNIVWNPKAIADMAERLQSDARIATFEAREKFRQMTQQVQQTASQGQQQERALDAVLAQFQAQHPELTPQDMQAAKQHFGQFANVLFRQATPEDAQQFGYRVGELLIDTPKMVPYFENYVALRASTAANEKARKQAEEENRKRQPAPPVVSPRQAAAQRQPRAKDGTFAEKQAERERVKRELNARHRRGEFYSDTKSDDV